MKIFLIKNKIYVIFFTIILLLLVSFFTYCLGMEDYENVNFSLGIVNTDYLNMRSGVGLDFDSIDILTKNEYVRIFGKIGNWYIIQNEENKIGAVHINYITPTDQEKSAVTNTETIEEVSNINLTSDESFLLSLINTEREKNNLSAFEIDDELQNIAKLKAQDLVQNNYFSHTSPTYGTPFEMLKSYNISYKTASENIAGNSDISSAFNAWMNSDSHKNNILSNNYNYTGIAIVDSIAYGKIIVQLFIGR